MHILAPREGEGFCLCVCAPFLSLMSRFVCAGTPTNVCHCLSCMHTYNFMNNVIGNKDVLGGHSLVCVHTPSQFSRLGIYHFVLVPCTVRVWCIGSGLPFFSSSTTNLASVLCTCIYFHVHQYRVLPIDLSLTLSYIHTYTLMSCV